MNKLESWRLFALGSAFFAALTAIFGKIGVVEINSNLATFFRTCVILLITGLVVTVRGEWQRPDAVPLKALIFLLLSALATGLSWLCYYRALQTGPASSVAPIDKLSVVMVMLLAFVFLGESLALKQLIGGGLVALGAIIIALP